MSTTALPPLSAIALTDIGVLRMQGADAAKFLQGYLTCDLDELAGSGWQYGALCTREGRVVATAIVSGSPDDICMRMPIEIIPSAQAMLAKYAVFARAKLRDDSANWTGVGIVAATADGLAAALQLVDSTTTPTEPPRRRASSDTELLVRNTRRCELWWTRSGSAAARLAAWVSSVPALSAARWRGEDIAAGWVRLTPALAGEYLPQALNLDAIGAVSFRKGCYLGQEIVTRLQHRGSPKQRLLRMAVAGAPEHAEGSAAEAADGVSGSSGIVGRVVARGRGEDGTLEVLAVVERRASGSPLQVDGFPAEVRNLPYALGD